MMPLLCFVLSSPLTLARAMLDPYTPQARIDADERAQALVPTGWLEHGSHSRFVFRFLSTAAGSIFIYAGLMMWSFGVSFGQEWFWTSLTAYGLSQTPIINARYRERAARLSAASLDREYDFDPNEYPRSVSHSIFRMGEELRELPETVRNEARPLWDNAMKAAELVKEKSNDKSALSAFEARATAIHKLHRAHEVLEETARAKDEAIQAQELDRRRAPILDALLQNTEDVRAAEIYAEALRAGSAKLRELS